MADEFFECNIDFEDSTVSAEAPPSTPQQPEKSCLVDAPKSRFESLTAASWAFFRVTEFFEPFYRHYILTAPLSLGYRKQTAHCTDVWVAALAADPLGATLFSRWSTSNVATWSPLRLSWRSGARALHKELAHGLLQVERRSLTAEALAALAARACASPHLQAKAMDALSRALEADERSCARAAAGGALDSLFGAMAARPRDAELAASALYAVMLLLRPLGAAGSGAESCRFKSAPGAAAATTNVRCAAVTDGGAAVVLGVMREHLSTRRVQYMG